MGRSLIVQNIERKKNRKVFVGSYSTTWSVPPNVTEVEVHCWGGGGNGKNSPAYGGGGGGGGYVRHIYPVSGNDVFTIVVGGQGGTSSVSVATQSPGSPISATGGTTSVGNPGGSGGAGAFTIAAGISTEYTVAYPGGDGGTGSIPNAYSGGGGSAGSPFGAGVRGSDHDGGKGGGGAGLLPWASQGYPGTNIVGGSSVYINLNSQKANIESHLYNLNTTTVGIETSINGVGYNSPWFYVDEITGIGGTHPTTIAKSSGLGAGTGGAGGIISGGVGGNGTFLGGGGGAGIGAVAGNGGIGGGGGGGAGGSGGQGGTGCVIIYW